MVASKAEQILERIQESDNDKEYMLVYSFGLKSPPIRFYDNLKRLEKKLKLQRLVKGCIICKGIRTTRALIELCKEYHARYWVFEIKKIEEES